MFLSENRSKSAKMAEQVNQRIEDMINELEQMRRTTLYNDEEIKLAHLYFHEIITFMVFS